MFAPDFGGVKFGGFSIWRFEGGKVVRDSQYDDHQLRALEVVVGGNNH